MEDVIGGRGADERFARFLADWERILDRRVGEASEIISTVRGVRGLVLAGGVGRGAPWPLSDIDILPIYDDREAESARDEIKRRRQALLEPWIVEGCWTGLDIGRLAFGCTEVVQVLEDAEPELSVLLADDRWYHALRGMADVPSMTPTVWPGRWRNGSPHIASIRRPSRAD